MSQEQTNSRFSDDPRIDSMVCGAGEFSELLLNADFLLGEYMTEFLKAVDGLRLAVELGLTTEQRIKLVIWSTALKEAPDGDTQTFRFMQAVLHARANLGRQTVSKLLDDLADAYIRICRPDAIKEDALGVDILAGLRVVVSGHLSVAQKFLREAAVMGPDTEES